MKWNSAKYNFPFFAVLLSTLSFLAVLNTKVQFRNHDCRDICKGSFVIHLLYFAFAQWHRQKLQNNLRWQSLCLIYRIIAKGSLLHSNAAETYINFLLVLPTKDPFISSCKFPPNARWIVSRFCCSVVTWCI